MAQKPYCCRTKVRFCFTLILVAGSTLFMFNILTQVLDIPPSGSQLQQEFHQRHEIIDKWRKERGSQQNKPMIAEVPCTGPKCHKLMGVFGFDDQTGGEVLQHCKHPLFLKENDTLAHAFPTLPPLACKKPSPRSKCRYSKGRIIVAPKHTCLLQTIHRPDGKDSIIEYKSPKLISTSMALPVFRSADHYRLSCVTSEKLASSSEKNLTKKFLALLADGQVDEQHFFTHISKYPDGKPEDFCGKERCLPYSVLVLGIGSLSQMSFRRLLPKTYDYFTASLKSANFPGYNVVGNGASGALLPMLSGLDESSQPEIQINKMKTHFVDRLDLLWNTYDSHGYMTLYAEDHPSTNTFNGRFQGFERPPTAHYMRPFWLAAESLNTSTASHCLGGKPKHQYMFDYLLEFFSAYSDDKRFAIAMLKDLTESDITLAQHLDNDLLKFLKDMHSHLENTTVILMSDHGVQPKQSITSWQSKAEARMPLMSIYLPSSFMTDYEHLAHTMINNEDKLITPYDVHHTLKDIIDIHRLDNKDPRDEGRHGQSLFRPVPVDRTCEKAGVNIHWCACHTQYSVKAEQVDQAKIKDIIMTELNKFTALHRDHCTAYANINVLNITRLVPNEMIKEYEAKASAVFTSNTLLNQNYYQVTFKVTTSKDRGGGDFYEVTLEHSNVGLMAVLTNSYNIVSDVVRLNKVPKRGCAVDRDILRYCSCVES